MRRRGKTGGKTAKTQRPKTLKRRNASKAGREPPAVDTTERIALLEHRLNETLEQQAATSEVLQVISSSPGELKPVFDALLANAVRICDAKFGTLFLTEGAAFRYVALHGAPPAFAEARRRESITRVKPGTTIGRVAATKKPAQIADIRAEPAYTSDPERIPILELAGARTILGVPMLKESQLVGIIVIYRQEVRSFTDKQIDLLSNFAAQAVIAIENTRLLNELREALEQQTATSEVLKVISSSPGDLDPVFETMLANAVRICGAKFGNLFLCEADGLRAVAFHDAPQAYVEERRRNPVRHPTPATVLGRAMASRQPVQVPDIQTYEPDSIDAGSGTTGVKLAQLAGARTVLAVPMVKESELVGALTIYRQEVLPFTDKQVELVQNFAAQAVIAIENTRLLSELRESLQQQTATADVLKVISRSTFDLQTVLDTLVESAARLCGAEMANIWRPRDGAYRLTASYGVTARYKESLENKEFLNTIAIEPGRGTTVGRVLLERKSVHIHDIQADPDYKLSGLVALGGTRTMLGIPMLREGDPIGVLVLVQSAVRPFTDKQIELATTFADQAVIAIENVRLFEEVQARTRDLSELLEQQTATSEVLQVISSSAGELKPVFETMLESAVRICGAKFGNLLLVEGDAFRHVALHGAPQAYLEERRREPVIRPRPGSDLDRIRSTKQIVHVADLQLGGPATAAIVELAGARTFLNVPMLKDNELIGTIGIYRQEVRPFTDKQIELLTSFAAQAVIAIENARLLSELRQREQDLTEKSTTLAALSSKLAKYLAPQVYDSIFTGRQDVKIVSARKKLTVCFSDLVGFTEITDQMELEDLTQLLNQYLTEMSKIALQYGATIDKYVGDAIVMFFGDPTTLGVKQDALACVQMAIAMQQRVGELAQEWRGIGIGTPLRCRIGIHTGYCTVGNFGSEDRMDYTMVGGTVNLASRLEHEAPPGGILISFETCAHVKDEVHCEERGQVQVKGIAYPIATYAVLGPKQDPERDVTAHLRLDIDPDRMTDDERRAAADKLRRALGLLEKGAKPNG